MAAAPLPTSATAHPGFAPPDGINAPALANTSRHSSAAVRGRMLSASDAQQPCSVSAMYKNRLMGKSRPRSVRVLRS